MLRRTILVAILALVPWLHMSPPLLLLLSSLTLVQAQLLLLQLV